MSWLFRCVLKDEAGNELVTRAASILGEIDFYTITYDAGADDAYFYFNGERYAYDGCTPGTYYTINGRNTNEVLRPGYNFVGWEYNGSIVYALKPTGDITLTARWEKEAGDYTITYKANGGKFGDGESTHIINAVEGVNYLDYKDTPDYEGHEFIGWKYNGHIVKKVTITSASVEVTAVWEELIPVTWNAGEGYVYGYDEVNGWGNYHTLVEYAHAGTYFVDKKFYNENPDIMGFDGWTVNGAKVYKIELSGPITVTAKCYTNVTVTYDANGGQWGNGDYSETARNRGVKPGDDYWVSENWPWRDGYNFKGWSTNKNASADTVERNFSTAITEDTTFYAIWAKWPVVTYDANDGKGGYLWYEYLYSDSENPIFTYGVLDSSNGSYAPFNMEACTDFYKLSDCRFIAYVDDPEFEYAFFCYDADYKYLGCSGYSSLDSGYISNPNVKDGTVYVRLAVCREDGCDLVDSDLNEIRRCIEIYRKKYTQTSAVNYDGEFNIWDGNVIHDHPNNYLFLGWSTNKNASAPEYFPGQMLKGLKSDLHLYPVCERMPLVTYHANGGAWYSRSGEEIFNSEDVQYDWDKQNYYYTVRWGSPERDGYEFTGWADKNGVKYDDVQIVLNKDYDFYATWAKRVTITYEANEGYFDGWDDYYNETRETHYRTALAGETYRIDGWRPDRNGYGFLGWSTVKNATEPEYLSNQELEGGLEYDITLYAVWRAYFTVTYDGNGGYLLVYDDEKCEYVEVPSCVENTDCSSEGDWWF